MTTGEVTNRMGAYVAGTLNPVDLTQAQRALFTSIDAMADGSRFLSRGVSPGISTALGRYESLFASGARYTGSATARAMRWI